MSPHRRVPPPDEQLLAKYQQLLRKHEALVARLEARNTQHVTTWKLSSWALETSASGLMLLRGEVIQLANSRWHTFARLPGAWQNSALPGSPPLSLRDVAQAEAQLTLGGMGPRAVRYHQVKGDVNLELRTDLLQEAPGAETRVLVLALDITEQVRAEQELARARESLARREHMRGLGEMAAGVVHDLSGTLNAMRLRLDLIERDTDFAPRQRGNLDALSHIVQDASTRVQHLGNFARQQAPVPMDEQVRLADVVHEAAEIARGDILHRAAQEGLRLELDVQVPALPPVRGSSTDLRYVVINLLLNARDAMPRGGTLRLRGRVDDGHVELTVADEGTGIPEQHLRDIFRPFFTTKGAKGTGLGLSMAYGVVSQAGGTITAANRPEGGALFTLRFPRLLSAPAPKPKPAKPRSRRR